MLSPKDLLLDPCLRLRDTSHLGSIFIKKKFDSCKHMYVKSLSHHTGSVNAIEFDKKNEFLASGGDDTSVLLWNIDRCILGDDSDAPGPVQMAERHISNIFALQFDCDSQTLASAGNDGIIFLHDLATCQLVRGMVRTRSVFGLSCHPSRRSLLVAAFSDGRVIQYDTRTERAALPLLSGCRAASCVAYHPTCEHLLLAATAATGVCLLDIRRPLQPCRSIGPANPTSSLYAAFDSTGSAVLVVGRRRCPALYGLLSSSPTARRLATFDDPAYYSSCTSKSCCFAGPGDAYVAAGGDACQLFLWRRPAGGDGDASDNAENVEESEVHVPRSCLTLLGHRSVVNQVRYSPRFALLASSGVDLSVRVWSPFAAGAGFSGGVNSADVLTPRPVFTHAEFLSGGGLVGVGGGRGGAICRDAKERQLAAYFDSLLQRDVSAALKDVSYSSSSTSSSSSSSSSPSSTSSEEDDAKLKSLGQLRRRRHCQRRQPSRLDRIRAYLPPRWTTESESDNSSSELSSHNSSADDVHDVDVGAGGVGSGGSGGCLHSYSKRRRSACGPGPMQQRQRQPRRHGPCGCRVRHFRAVRGEAATDSDREYRLDRLRQMAQDAHQRLGMAALAGAGSVAAAAIAACPLLSLRPASMLHLVSVARLLHHRGPMPAGQSPTPSSLLLPGSRRLLEMVTDVRTFPCLSWRCHRRFIRRVLCTFAFVLFADCSDIGALLLRPVGPAFQPVPRSLLAADESSPPPAQLPAAASSSDASSSSSESSASSASARHLSADESHSEGGGGVGDGGGGGVGGGMNGAVSRLLQMPLVYFSDEADDSTESSSVQSEPEDADG